MRFPKMNAKGQITIHTMYSVLFLLIFFFVWLQIANPIMNDLLFPQLDNTDANPYGATIKLMFQIVPLLLAVLIVAYPFTSSNMRRQGNPPVEF